MAPLERKHRRAIDGQPGLFLLVAAKGGKTAEAIARDLGRPLHRLDLAAIASAHAGETEKALDAVLAAAAKAGAVLLFDEADALFGKRGDARDSHDRHANIEPGYLLARLDRHKGPVIVMSSRAAALDPAFARRIRARID